MGVMDSRGGLSGRKAAIIGGAGGIGGAVTMALLHAGVDVAFCDRDAQAVKAMTDDIRRLGRDSVAQTEDATDPQGIKRFYDAVERAFGRIDIMVNVVGGVILKPFLEKTSEECADDIQRNFGYVLDSTRLAVPLLRKSGRGGSIVNFTTIEAHRAAGGFAVYAGAKAATTNFSKAMAWELGPDNIRVNVIAPDTTPSRGNHDALPPAMQASAAAVPPEWWAKAMQMYIPLGVPPAVEDLANAVLFLASDLARSITGQVLHVDGGTAAALGMIRWPLDGGVTLPVPAAETLKKLFGSP